jgi:hypothetical protein
MIKGSVFQYSIFISSEFIIKNNRKRKINTLSNRFEKKPTKKDNSTIVEEQYNKKLTNG